MAVKVLEIHHHAVRIGADDKTLLDLKNFYGDVLGLHADEGAGLGGARHVGGQLPAAAHRNSVEELAVMGVDTRLQIGTHRIRKRLERIAVDLVAPGEDQGGLHALRGEFARAVGVQHDDCHRQALQLGDYAYFEEPAFNRLL